MKTSEIKIHTEFIKLDQLLKFANIAENGADAKDMIYSKIVKVNDEICTMRGKKIRNGDIVTVEFEDEQFMCKIIGKD